MNYLYGLLMSWGMFTIIPCPYRGWKEEARRHMLMMYPVTGAFIGLIWWGVASLSTCLSAFIGSFLIAIVPWILTGFMHLDGYMDVMDAVMSRRDLATRQAILKDSRCGAFAVIGVVLLIICQIFAALTLVFGMDSFGIYGDGPLNSSYVRFGNSFLSLVLIPIASRAAAAMAVLRLKAMNTSQYGTLEKKKSDIILPCLFIIATVAISTLISGGLEAVLVTLIVYVVCVTYGFVKLGGMNGDISGFALSISELAGILSLSLL